MNKSKVIILGILGFVGIILVLFGLIYLNNDKKNDESAKYPDIPPADEKEHNNQEQQKPLEKKYTCTIGPVEIPVTMENQTFTCYMMDEYTFKFIEKRLDSGELTTTIKFQDKESYDLYGTKEPVQKPKNIKLKEENLERQYSWDTTVYHDKASDGIEFYLKFLEEKGYKCKEV